MLIGEGDMRTMEAGISEGDEAEPGTKGAAVMERRSASRFSPGAGAANDVKGGDGEAAEPTAVPQRRQKRALTGSCVAHRPHVNEEEPPEETNEPEELGESEG